MQFEEFLICKKKYNFKKITYKNNLLQNLHNRDFSKHFLLPLFGGKNSIFNWVLKFNPSSFIIPVTYISLQLPKFYS